MALYSRFDVIVSEASFLSPLTSGKLEIIVFTF